MQMIDLMKRLAELDAGNPNIIHEGQGSPVLQQLLAMQQKYRGTPYEQQLNKRVADQQWREANGKGAPVDAAGRPVPVLSPEEFEKKNPNYLKAGSTPAASTNKNWLVTPDEAKASRDEEARQAALKESTELAECGIMPMTGMGGQTHTPASISMTANSGPELSGMLADIMKLAGVHQVEPAHLGVDHEPAILTAEPSIDLDHDHSSGEMMRSVLDKMNPDMDDKEEADEGMYDNSPADSEPPAPFDANEFAHRENQPGQGDRMDGNMPRAYPTMEEQLMADWKQFMTESSHHHHREISVNGKEVDTDSLEIDGIDMRDYPDFVDAYFSDGEFMDGSEMSQDELDYLRDHHGELLYNKIQDRLHESSQNVAEGDSGAKYRVKSVGNDVNPATDERCDYYINPVTDKKVYCKPGQKVSKGDHVNPNTGKVTPKG